MTPHLLPRARAGRIALTAAVLVVTAACSGPEAPLNVGMNSRPVELLLGQRIRVVAENVSPPISPSFAPTGYLDDVARTAPGLPVRRPPGQVDPAKPITCPVAPGDAAILTPKTPTPPGPPSSATYTYRLSGTMTVSGSARALPSEFTRDVGGARSEPPAGYVFDAFDSMGGTTAVTSFRLVPNWYPASPESSNTDIAESIAETQTGQQAPESPVGSRAQPGLYILRMAATDPGFRVPEPGIKLVDFPVSPRATFTAVATDGVTTMTYTSTVNPTPARVDACGVLLDVHQVDLAGEISKSAPGEQQIRAQFTSSYGIATQFGALVVWEKLRIESADVSRTSEATINQEPARAQQPGQASG